MSFDYLRIEDSRRVFPPSFFSAGVVIPPSLVEVEEVLPPNLLLHPPPKKSSPLYNHLVERGAQHPFAFLCEPPQFICGGRLRGEEPYPSPVCHRRPPGAEERKPSLLRLHRLLLSPSRFFPERQ